MPARTTEVTGPRPCVPTPSAFAGPSTASGLLTSDRSRRAGELRASDKQLFPHHQIYGQGTVTDRVEENDHGVARVAHHQSGTPDLVHDLAVDRERLGRRRLYPGQTGQTVVAVVAWRRVDLAKIVEDVLPATAVHVGVAAHHLDSRSGELAEVLLSFGGLLGRVGHVPVRGRDDRSRRQHIDRADLLQPVEGDHDLRLWEFGPFADLLDL